MGQHSTIEWTDVTWNPVTGCTQVSPGCQHCYAARLAFRLQAMGHGKYQGGFGVALHAQTLEHPLRWKQTRKIFVNSMSDLFHSAVLDPFIRRVFGVMREASWHTFQVLTKRAERLATLGQTLPWPPNIWMGVSVETPPYLSRLDQFRRVPAHVRFVSCEPLLADLGALSLTGIDWVIVGGESGPGARPMEPTWVRGIRDQCVAAGVPFFFKQWGGVHKKRAGRVLDGHIWAEWPRQRFAAADRPGSSASGRATP